MKKNITFSSMVCVNDVMRDVIKKAGRIAKSDRNTLLMGEIGVGRETLAQAIHNASDRSDGPFISLDCSDFPNGMMNTELFGIEKGASPGVVYSVKGILERLDGGTLFINEIHEMDLMTQANFLQFLYKSVTQHIGGDKQIPINVRIIAGCNRKIVEAIEKGEFLQNLFYGIKKEHVEIPSLKERMEDLPSLVDCFIHLFNKENQKKIKGISDAAMDYLKRHDWPRNLQELKDAIDHAGNCCETDGVIWIDHLPKLEGGEKEFLPKFETKPLPLEEAEKRNIQLVLEYFRFNKSKAAIFLGISRPTLDRKMKKYGLDAPKVRIVLSEQANCA